MGMKLSSMVSAPKNTPRTSDLSLLLIVFTLMCYIFVCFTAYHSNFLAEQLLLSYVEIPIFAVMGCCFCRGDYFRRKYSILSLAFLLCLVLSCWLRGDLIWDDSIRFSFVKFCLLCGIALPFSLFSGDRDSRKLLHILVLPALMLFACFLWLAFAALILGENICILPEWFEFGSTYTSTGRMMLKVLNIHYYRTGYLSVCCFFACLYLAVSRWSAKSAPFWILLLVTFAAGILITYSRTAVFAFVGGLLLAFHIFLDSCNISRKKKYLLFGVSILASAVLTVLIMNSIYRAVHSIRDIWYSISTLSSRTDLWGASLSVLREHPDALLRGLDPEMILTLVKSHLPEFGSVAHLHSGYLQTLLSVGIPGFSLVLAFCLYLCKCAFRIFFAPTSSAVKPADKCLILVPMVCLAMNLAESALFYCYMEAELLNLFTALFAGYIFEKSRCI